MSAEEEARSEAGPAGRLGRFILDDSMSLALLSLFLCCIVAQIATGWHAYDQARQTAHLRPISLPAYLRCGHFLDGIFSNWQAAILQLAVLVAFGSVLRQRGAAHSRKTPINHRQLTLKLRPRESVSAWLYANSLSLALTGLFLLCFTLHALFGAWKFDENQALRGLPGTTIGAFLKTADFWSSTFECWEAEFGAIALYVVFSIFLRQEYSPESKHVESRDGDTGDANE